MPNEINKEHKFLAVMDEDGNISDVIENQANQVTTSGREIMIVADTEADLKAACYSSHTKDIEGKVSFTGRTITQIRKRSKIAIKEKNVKISSPIRSL